MLSVKYYTEIEPYDIITVSVNKRKNGKNNKVVYDDNIYTLDTETTSIFIFNDRVEIFDYNKPVDYYSNAVSAGYMYIWTFSVNDTVYYGRTGAELLDFLTRLNTICPYRKIVYIHNQSFDFQFIRNYITDFDVFARSPRQPMTAHSKTYNIECRDSLVLTNTKLEMLPKVFNLPVEKLVGDLDYNKLRNSKTPLSERELAYCEHDNLVLYHCILKFKDIYKHVCKIPLTQTGIIRKECQALYKKNYAYHAHIKNIYPKTAADYYFQRRAFFGGYVHANYLYAGKILENVKSYDFCSSYPTVLLCEKYPQGKFISSGVKRFENLNEKDYCYILDITFENVTSKTYNHYLSLSKCYDIYKADIDNGRIMAAQRIRVYCTNVDLQIIRKAYKFTNYTINKAHRARLGYLDRDFLLKILELYNKKTTLKNVAGMETEYLHAKQKLNSLFGMAVTNNIRDLCKFENNEWLEVKPMSDSEVTNALIELSNSFSTFLVQGYGIFCTAWARKNLWSAILQCDERLVYADTDSIKVIGDVTEIVEKYNKDITAKLRKAMIDNDIDVSLLSPKDINGIAHPLGVFENDGNYKRFITLGAKKYAYEDMDGELHITLSGVNSKTGAAGLKKLENFKKGFLFDYKASGKNLVTYNDMQAPITLVDEYGNSETHGEVFGVNLRPNVYMLGIDPDFEELLAGVPGHSLTCSNIEKSDLI